MTEPGEIRVHAPGKLMLAGEYAVLLPGGAAIVAALDRGIDVRARDADAWSVRHGNLFWSQGEPTPRGLAFAVAAVQAVRARLRASPKSLETLGNLDEGGVKTGLGGSAAATVGAVLAAARGTGASFDDLWRLADEVHREVQGGVGSGADVAASMHGGILRYMSEPRQARLLAVHAEVRMLAAWSGTRSETASSARRFEEFVRARPDEAWRFLQLSAQSVEALERALTTGDSGDLRGAFGMGRAALRGLEAAMGIELETAPLRLAADLAWRSGACAKPSGAGGGDCAVVLASGDEAAARVRRDLESAGLRVFAVAPAPRGAEVAGMKDEG